MSGMRISFLSFFINFSPPFYCIAGTILFSRMFWLSHAELNIAQYLTSSSPFFPINTNEWERNSFETFISLVLGGGCIKAIKFLGDFILCDLPLHVANTSKVTSSLHSIFMHRKNTEKLKIKDQKAHKMSIHHRHVQNDFREDFLPFTDAFFFRVGCGFCTKKGLWKFY